MHTTIESPSLNGHAAGSVETLTIPPKPKRRWIAAIAALIVIVALVAGIIVYRSQSAAAVTYTTVPVQKQTLVQSVTATGTLNPQNTIAVGTQQSGTISEIDVDFNSKVHKGQVLARIDDTSLRSQLQSAQAQLAQAQQQAQAANANAGGSASSVNAAVASANAAAATQRAAAATAQSNTQAIAAADSNTAKAQSALTLAQQTVSRDQTLVSQGYLAQNQLDADRSAFVAAQTGVAGAQVAAAQARSQAQASAAQAQASIAQTAAQNASTETARDQAAGNAASAAASTSAIGIQEANVQQAQTNLQRAVITSPVDGTVISRAVSVGQTVAASFSTPTLFSIAQDLSKMELDLSVGEPDIGAVKAGENVSFTVLAYPNTTFTGKVSALRIAPATVSNVVTYTTVVLVDNKDQKLLPGMTANATIATATASNSLVVPTAALSFVPAGNGAHRGNRPATATTATTPAAGSANSSPWGTTTGSAATIIAAGANGHVFVQRDGKLARVPVHIDLVSGTQAAVTTTGSATQTLAVGDQVVTGANGASNARKAPTSTSTNPFATQRGGGGGGGRGGPHS